MPRRSRAATGETTRHSDIAAQMGARIRQARIEAGMTLAELAGEDLSRSFLSLVENGRSGISPRNLKVIADRLGKPMSAFLTDAVAARRQAAEIVLSDAELALLEARPGDALRDLDGADVPEDLLSRALWLRGWAEFNLARERDATLTLQRALAADDGSDAHLESEIRYRLGRALYQDRHYIEAEAQFNQAIKLAWDEGDEGLAASCRVMLGHLYGVRNDFEAAIAHYDAAEGPLESLRNFNVLAASYAGKGNAYREQGDMVRALHYMQLAIGILEARNREYDVVMELNNMAYAYLQAGRAAKGLTVIDPTVQRAVALGNTELEALARSTRAALLLELDRTTEAQAEAEAVITRTANEPRMAAAWASVVLAELADRAGNHAQTDDLYQRALAIFDEGGENGHYATIAFRYGDVLLRRGEDGAAARWMKTAQAKMPPPGLLQRR